MTTEYPKHPEVNCRRVYRESPNGIERLALDNVVPPNLSCTKPGRTPQVWSTAYLVKEENFLKMFYWVQPTFVEAAWLIGFAEVLVGDRFAYDLMLRYLDGPRKAPISIPFSTAQEYYDPYHERHYFDDPRFIGRSFSIEDTSLVAHQEMGAVIGHTAGLARADFS